MNLRINANLFWSSANSLISFEALSRMNNGERRKRVLLDFIVKAGVATIGMRPTEELIAKLCRTRVARNYFKTGGLAYSYVDRLSEVNIRAATLDGYSIFVNIKEAIGANAYFFGWSGTIWLVEALLRKGDLFVDAGANMGHYAMFAANRVGADGKVLAFEPNPANLNLLKRSIEANGFEEIIVAFDQALWKNSSETLEFFLSENISNTGTSSLIYHGVNQSRQKSIKVQTITLDDCLSERGLNHCRLIKIDVERAEFEVLQGMARLLRGAAIDYLIIEMYAHSDSERFLFEQNYAGFLIDEKEKRLIEISEVEDEKFGDYLFVSPCARDEFNASFALSTF